MPPRGACDTNAQARTHYLARVEQQLLNTVPYQLLRCNLSQEEELLLLFMTSPSALPKHAKHTTRGGESEQNHSRIHV